MLITPDTLRLLDAFALRSKRSFFGIRQGAHRSRRRGHGIEFAEYRNYERGDNPRAIDWNLYSRCDKLYVKRYLEEENVSLYIIIDGSRSLTHVALREKWDFAIHLAACASYIALATQDPVTISILGGPHSPSYWGGKAFTPLTSFLSTASDTVVGDSSKQLDIIEEARKAATRVRFPGICIVISDFLYPLASLPHMFAGLRARNMEIHAVQILGTHDVSPAGEELGGSFTDSETGSRVDVSLSPEDTAMYSELLRTHNEAVRAHCLSNHISYVLTSLEDQHTKEHFAISTLTRMGLFV